MDFLIIAVMLTPLVLGFLIVRAIRKYEGNYRRAAWVPAIVLGALAIKAAADVSSDSSAHNLWPLELLMWSAGGFVYMGVLALLVRESKRQRPDRSKISR